MFKNFQQVINQLIVNFCSSNNNITKVNDFCACQYTWWPLSSHYQIPWFIQTFHV